MTRLQKWLVGPLLDAFTIHADRIQFVTRSAQEIRDAVNEMRITDQKRVDVLTSYMAQNNDFHRLLFDRLQQHLDANEASMREMVLLLRQIEKM